MCQSQRLDNVFQIVTDRIRGLQDFSAPTRRQGTKSLYWPLTRRGLFSEILVYAYVKECLATEGILVKPLIPMDLSKYWTILFPNQEFNYSFLTSNILNPVCPPPKLLCIFGNLVPAIRNLTICDQYFRQLWTKDAEARYIDKNSFIECIAQHISSFLCLDDVLASYPLNKHNAIHLRRGDKVYNANPEAKLIAINRYIELAELHLSKCMPLLIFSDSYHHASILSERLTLQGFQKVRPMNTSNALTTKGYNQRHFNKLNLRLKLLYSKSFLNEFKLMVCSNVLICTYSSCVGRTAYIMRRTKDTISADTAFSIVQ